jgi:hypothetical protein
MLGLSLAAVLARDSARAAPWPLALLGLARIAADHRASRMVGDLSYMLLELLGKRKEPRSSGHQTQALADLFTCSPSGLDHHDATISEFVRGSRA